MQLVSNCVGITFENQCNIVVGVGYFDPSTALLLHALSNFCLIQYCMTFAHKIGLLTV